MTAVSTPCHAGQFIAYHDSPVDSDGARRGLGNGHQIQHLLFINPVVFVYKFLLHQCDDDISATEGKCAQIQG